MRVEIAQKLVTSLRNIVVENFSARADQLADSFGLVADLEWTPTETTQEKTLSSRIGADGESRTEYIAISQWQCFIEYMRRGECVGRARIRNHCETILGGNWTHLERQLGQYSKRSERAAHQLHQIITGNVFDHAATAVNEFAAVADEASSAQQAAPGAPRHAQLPPPPRSAY